MRQLLTFINTLWRCWSYIASGGLDHFRVPDSRTSSSEHYRLGTLAAARLPQAVVLFAQRRLDSPLSSY
jgi:hypothetical protein